jgi:hypothetical protein
MTLRFRKTKNSLTCEEKRMSSVIEMLLLARHFSIVYCAIDFKTDDIFSLPEIWEHAIRTSINQNMPICGILITTILAGGHFTNVVIHMR